MSEATPRRASHDGNPTRYFISFVESSPLSCGAVPVTDAVGAHVEGREMRVPIRYLDALAVLSGEADPAVEDF
jgi:hypothetical protein